MWGLIGVIIRPFVSLAAILLGGKIAISEIKGYFGGDKPPESLTREEAARRTASTLGLITGAAIAIILFGKDLKLSGRRR